MAQPGGHACGAPYIVCKSEDIPLIIDTRGNRHLRDLNNTVLLSPSKDAIVPSGAAVDQNSENYHICYGQAIFKSDSRRGAPSIVCKSEDIPLKIDTTGNRHLRYLNNTVLLGCSKDAIVPTGATMG